MTIVTPTDGESVELGGLGVRFMATGEGFSLVEHPIAPRTVAEPMHVHEHEDEYSYVLEGEVGFQIGDQIDYADETPLVRTMFAEALAKHGLQSRMEDAYQAELADLPPKAA